MKRPGENQIIVPLGAVLAAKRAQQQKRKNQHFEQPSPMGAANVKAVARRAAPQQIKSLMGHGR
jgi:hypothetical protein